MTNTNTKFTTNAKTMANNVFGHIMAALVVMTQILREDDGSVVLSADVDNCVKAHLNEALDIISSIDFKNIDGVFSEKAKNINHAYSHIMGTLVVMTQVLREDDGSVILSTADDNYIKTHLNRALELV